MSGKPTEAFGVVAIGRNEGERLKQCLKSVSSATQTIYVDSGSTDGSPQWARTRSSLAGGRAATPFTDTWQQVDQAVSGIIDKTSFADLLRRWHDQQNKFVLNWEI